MASINNNITISRELRLCEVNGEIGYFHCWEWYASVVDASLVIGGHPGGQVSQIFGLVEFRDGVKRIDPARIKFSDETNEILKDFNEMKRLREKGCKQ